MKKTIFYSTIILLSFFISCSESAQRTEQKTENSGTTVKEPVPNNIVDTSKRTSISVGANGVGVNSKNTKINVDKNGVRVGTKDVDIQIKK